MNCFLQRFCPECGKDTNEVIDGLCPDCFPRKIRHDFFPKKIVVEKCAACSKLRFKGKVRAETDDLLKEIILSNLKTGDFEVKDLSLALVKKDDAVYDVTANMMLSKSGVKFRVPARTVFELRGFRCDTCMKLISDYFEATIQLRGFSDSEKLVDEMSAFLSKAGKDDALSAITGGGTSKQGVDVNIGSLRAAKKLVKFLVGKYDLSVMHSDSIAGYDSDKEKPKKRFTYCLRPKESG